MYGTITFLRFQIWGHLFHLSQTLVKRAKNKKGHAEPDEPSRGLITVRFGSPLSIGGAYCSCLRDFFVFFCFFRTKGNEQAPIAVQGAYASFAIQLRPPLERLSAWKYAHRRQSFTAPGMGCTYNIVEFLRFRGIG